MAAAGPSPSAAPPLLEVSALARHYGAHRGLCGLAFSLRRGERLGLLGPNGAGKSTCLRLLSGNLAPDQGRVLIDGIDLARRPRAARARLGYLPEGAPVYPELTVDEHLRFAARLQRVPRRALPAALARAKARCGLADQGRALLGRLSKGYRQRAAVAAALIHEPPLLIFDEPTDGLDPVQAREFRNLLLELTAGPDPAHGVIVSSHALAEVQAVCTRVVILGDGRQLAAVDLTRADGPASVLFVRLRPPPVLGSLAALPPVAAAVPAGPDRFQVTLRPGADAADLARALVQRDFGLLELAPGGTDLARLFFTTIGGGEPCS